MTTKITASDPNMERAGDRRGCSIQFSLLRRKGQRTPSTSKSLQPRARPDERARRRGTWRANGFRAGTLARRRADVFAALAVFCLCLLCRVTSAHPKRGAQRQESGIATITDHDATLDQATAGNGAELSNAYAR